MENLRKIGLSTLNEQEMLTIEGGSWVSRAWNNTVDALESAYQWCKDTLSVDVQIGRV